MPLAVPAVEITYGLERILMALQGVDHFRDIRYSPTLTYGVSADSISWHVSELARCRAHSHRPCTPMAAQGVAHILDIC